MQHLSDIELRHLQDLLIEQGLVNEEWLDSLFLSLPPAVLARLPSPNVPGERLEQCLARLNAMGAVQGGIVPLEEVLERLTIEPIAAVANEAKRLLALLKPRFDEARRHPSPLQVPPGNGGGTTSSTAGGPTTLTLSLAWPDVERQAFRVEPAGTRCPAVATVHVTGAFEQPPVLEWRQRYVFGRGGWKPAELVPAESEKEGRTTWRSTSSIRAGRLRSSLLSVRARLGEDQARASRLVVPVAGLRAAVTLLVALLVFAIAWLVPLPSLALEGGLAVVALAAAIGVARGRLADITVRGPLSGVGTLERALGITIGAALAVVILPPLLLVIVENQTKAPVSIRTASKSIVSLAPGQGGTLMSWDGPPRAAQDNICVCSERRANGCFCHTDSIRFVEVHNIRCRRAEWKGLGPFGAAATFENAESLDGAVWLASDAACKPLVETAVTATFELAEVEDPTRPGERLAASGRVTVHHPWRADLGAVELPAGTRLERLAIVAGGGSGESPPWLVADHVTTTGPVTLPAFDPAWKQARLEVGAGAVLCERRSGFGAAPITLATVKAPADSKLVIDGPLASAWKGRGAPRACLRANEPPEKVSLVVPRLEPGLAFALPFAAPTVISTAGGAGLQAAAFKPISCDRPMAMVEVDPQLEPMKLREQPPGTRSWSIDPLMVGNRKLALVCDPPADPLVVLGRDDVRFELGPQALRRWSRTMPRPDVPPIHPDPVVPDSPTAPPDSPTTPVSPIQPPIRFPTHRLALNVCMILKSAPARVVHRINCPATHPSDPHIKCATIDDRLAADVTAREKRAGRTCTSVCLCRD